MSYKFKSFLSLALLVLMVAACSKSNNNDNDPNPDANDQGGSGTASTIVGTWAKVCTEAGPGVYVITTHSYASTGVYSDFTDFYSDASCSTATGTVKTSDGSYVLGMDLTTSSGLAATEIDVTFTSAKLNGVELGGTPFTFYDIVRIDGNTFYDGAGEASLQESGRVNDLDFTNTSIRQ